MEKLCTNCKWINNDSLDIPCYICYRASKFEIDFNNEKICKLFNRLIDRIEDQYSECPPSVRDIADEIRQLIK